MLRYFLIPIETVIAPDGVTERRPLGLAGYSWSAVFPDDGLTTFALVAVNAEDFTSLETNVLIDALPYVNDWNALLSTQFTQRTLNNLKAKFVLRGLPTAGITLTITFGQLMMIVASSLRPGITDKDYKMTV